MGRVWLSVLSGAVLFGALSGVAVAGNTSTNSSTNTSTNTSSDWHASNSSTNSSSNGSSNGAPAWRHGWHCDESEIFDDQHVDVRDDTRGGVTHVWVFESDSLYECD